jgi:hypothetical protein
MFGVGAASAAAIVGTASIGGVGLDQFSPTGGATTADYTGISFGVSGNDFHINGAGGDLAGISGEDGTILDFTYVPSFSQIDNFLVTLSNDATFTATSIIAGGPFSNGWTNDGQFLNLSFSGILHVTGFDDTYATLNFTGTHTGQPYTWTASLNAAGDPVVTPEPASLAILGAGLAGIGLMRRRKKAA